jgi:PleD family two-component response regulator
MYKILLIDKGRPSIQSFQKILTRKKFSLIKAPSLREAIRTFNKNEVDLIVVNKVFSSSSAEYKKFKALTADIPK